MPLSMYSVAVKIEGIESRRRTAGLMHIIIGFFLIAKGADYYRFLEYKTILPALPAFAVAAVSFAYGIARRRIDLTAKYNYLLRLVQVITFTTLGIAFIKISRPVDYWGLFIFAAICIVLLFSERRIFTATVIFLDETGVKIPGYYRDYLIKWQDLLEVKIREDFVTLFHRKQKYLQYQVVQDLSLLEVAKMNAFCMEKIKEQQPENE